jgi:hypothetical protein
MILVDWLPPECTIGYAILVVTDAGHVDFWREGVRYKLAGVVYARSLQEASNIYGMCNRQVDGVMASALPEHIETIWVRRAAN